MTDVRLIKYKNLYIAIPQLVMEGVYIHGPQVVDQLFALCFLNLRYVYQRLYASNIFMQQNNLISIQRLKFFNKSNKKYFLQ